MELKFIVDGFVVDRETAEKAMKNGKKVEAVGWVKFKNDKIEKEPKKI